jgi:L-fuconolactonase
MIIDAHQHYWDPARGDYGWMTPDLTAFWRVFAPGNLEPELASSGVCGTVLVQAAPTTQETDYLLALAEAHASIFGVVGWINLLSADACEQIAIRAAHPKFCGLRPMLQDLEDPAWILRADVAPALTCMASYGLVFDALVRPHQMAGIATLARRFPELTVVLDHAAKPNIANGQIAEWTNHLREFSGLNTVKCKLSGLLSEALPGADVADLQPYVDAMIEVFGSKRLIWGSDWPVLTGVSSYQDWLAMTVRLLSGFSHAERGDIMGGNSARIYRLATS